jgi:concanavalin A-like lectin/glucanase superfamily protein
MKTVTSLTLARSLVSLFVITIFIGAGPKDSCGELVGMWLFEDSGDVIVDSSGNGHDGEMIGDVERTDEGKIGKGVRFDGVAAVVDIPDSDALHSDAFTLMAWFKLEAATGSWQTIFGKQSGGAGLIVEVATGGVINTGFGTSWLCTGQTPIDDEEWHHAASVFDGDTVRLYIDGSLDEEAVGGTRPDHNALPLRIGGSPDIGEMFGGVIDEVAFFDHPLTELEIQGFMEKLVAMEPAGRLVATWGSIKAEH